HEHVVGNPDGHLFATHRIGDGGTQRHASLLALLLCAEALDLALHPYLLDIGLYSLTLLPRGHSLHPRVLRSQHKERYAVDGVGPCGEDWNLHVLKGLGWLTALADLGHSSFEVDLRAIGATDPVRLHQSGLLGPV